MDKKENKTDFDLSVLSLKELIELSHSVDDFLVFLDDQSKKVDIGGALDE